VRLGLDSNFMSKRAAKTSMGSIKQNRTSNKAPGSKSLSRRSIMVFKPNFWLMPAPVQRFPFYTITRWKYQCKMLLAPIELRCMQTINRCCVTVLEPIIGLRPVHVTSLPLNIITRDEYHCRQNLKELVEVV
jgi:hypothetical protein